MSFQKNANVLFLGFNGETRISRHELRNLVASARAGLAAKRSALELRYLIARNAASAAAASEEISDCEFADRMYDNLLNGDCDAEGMLTVSTNCLANLKEAGRLFAGLP